VTALGKIFNALGALYGQEPGTKSITTLDGKRQIWLDIFPGLGAKGAMENVASRLAYYPAVFGAIGITPEACLDIARELLKRQVGKVYRSRIHGDLNLTNLLLILNDDNSISSAFIIDLSHSKMDSVVSLDFARVEQELWRRIAGIEEGNLASASGLTSFINGDSAVVDASLRNHWIYLGEIVNEVRIAAKQYLGGADNASMFRDYFPPNPSGKSPAVPRKRRGNSY